MVRQVPLQMPTMENASGDGLDPKGPPWYGFRWPVCIELIDFPFSGDRHHSLSAVPRVLTLDPLL